MKKNNTKREMLLSAILTKDKRKLMEALQKNKPEKWMTFVMDHSKKIIQYQDKTVTESEMKSIIDESSKEYQVKLIVMNQNRTNEGLEETWSFCDPEIIVNFVNAT